MSIEATNICDILPRTAVSSELIVVKLKRDLKYKCHVYFEPVWTDTIYQALVYLKSYSNLYRDISIANGLSSDDIFQFFQKKILMQKK